MRKNCVPVRIRGVDYPSIKSAAHKLGVSTSTISACLHRYGHAEGAGLGVSSRRHNSTPHRVRPITLHGRQYPSIRVAADTLGLSYSWLYKAITKQQPADAGDRILAAMMRAETRKEAA